MYNASKKQAAVTDPDLELVEKARTGDSKAFSQLVNRHYEMVYVVAYGVLRDREHARDTTQEVFLKVHQDISRFKGDSKFRTWLYRVTTNAAIDQVRRRKPSISLDATDKGEDDEAPVVIPDQSPGPRQESEKEELKQSFARALEELSEDHRAVLVLREWQDLSYEEIAETLNLEMGTVMSRIFYARKKLGEVLKKMGIHHP